MGTGRLLKLSPGKIALVYLVFGVAWIGTTDTVVATFTTSMEQFGLIQTFKGWIFVGLSTVLIFGLTAVRTSQINRSQERVRTLTDQLQVMNRLLRHNIRNDVNVACGYINQVRSELTDETHRSLLEKATERSRLIVDRSDKMRVLSQVDIARETERTVDLVQLTEDAIRDVQTQHRDVSFSIDVPHGTDLRDQSDRPDRIPIRVDPVFRHAIVELLENAIQHGFDDMDSPRVELRITVTDGHPVLEIIDEGPGISAHELAVLQANVESDLEHMSGVGLWVATWLCNAENVDISFDSDSDSGTTVRLTFPSIDQ